MAAEFFQTILLAWAFAFAMMAVVWWLSNRIHNAGIVDIAWALGFAPVAIFYAFATNGFPMRRGLIATMVTLWSLRLGSYLYVRVMGHHPQEDRRYAQLRAEWGAKVKSRMFGFFQMQALLLVLLSVPFLLVCLNPAHLGAFIEWHSSGGTTFVNLDPGAGAECVGVIIWIIAWIGESLSDQQLKAFKADPANRGRVCDTGLWHYSRHPNYFFEWLIWVAYFLFALGSPWGWVTIYCPALMLFFLLKVTGIPMTEDLAVKTKGDQYREYQRTTSMFIPWFRKKL